MAGDYEVRPSPVLELAARIPTNKETQSLVRGGRNFQPPKWFQFKPRAIMGTPWLQGLVESENIQKRDRTILADEGGIGKTKASVILINNILSQNPEKPILILCPRRLIPSWKKEIRLVMRQSRDIVIGGNHSSARTVLSNPLPGKVYVVSKHSLSEHFTTLRKNNWNFIQRLFILYSICYSSYDSEMSRTFLFFS